MRPLAFIALAAALSCRHSEPAPDVADTPAAPESTAVESKASEPDATEPAASNAKRPESPRIAKLTVYRTSPDNLEGRITSVETFDVEGRRATFEAWDPYGEGVEDTYTNTYDERGNKIRVEKTGSQTMTETFEYDAQNREIGQAWTRGEQGASEKTTFDEHGNPAETKYFDAAGKYDFSRVWKYTYDDEGQAIEEWKWERTSDAPELEMYHYQRTYDDAGRVVKQARIKSDGSTLSHKRFEYDARGNKIATTDHAGDSQTPNARSVATVNEYGEIVKDEDFNCDDTGACTTRWQVTTTEYDEWGHVLSYMTVQEHGEDFGERRAYELAK